MESSIEMMLQKELFSVCFFNICSSDQKGKTRGDELWGAEKENYMQIFTRISSWSFRYILQGRHRLNLINCLSPLKVRKQKIPRKKTFLSLDSRANVSRVCERSRPHLSTLNYQLLPWSHALKICIFVICSANLNLKVIKYLHNTEHMLEIMYPSSIQSIQQYVSEYKVRRVLSSTVWIKNPEWYN